MSTRINKRKKNPFHRERTVTTLTEDPTTHLLVPTPTEEPPRYSIPQSYPIQIDHFYPQDPFSSTSNLDHDHDSTYPMPQTQAQTQFYPPQQPHSDLEVLENLKAIIKAGQHEFYRAVPQPQALAAIYLGPNAQVRFISAFSRFYVVYWHHALVEWLKPLAPASTILISATRWETRRLP
ncbi:hypothetical protein B0H12DRAFT_1263172 [Mycena haematopus]|nr:hypothetical protein B0H12DRAFT_1263172 [Mycena haematopus]